MESSPRPRIRALATTAGLVVLVVLIGALAYEAITAARAQRQAVESVLRDYAAIAAEQYASGISLALDYNWFFPVVRRLSRGDDGTLRGPERDAEIATQTGTYDAAELVTRFFAGHPDVDEWTGVEGWPDPAPGLEPGSRIDAAGALDEGWPLAVSLPTGDATGVVVYSASRDPDTGRPTVVGFQGPLRGFELVLGRALEPARVLPDVLMDVSGEELVSVRLLAPDDRILYQRGPSFDATFSATAGLDRRLGGLRVVTAVPAGSAERLVIGGLPRSRLPAIGLMLAVAVALLVGGVLVIRQERELVRLRERFVAGASHELRTPLAQIRLFAETLRLDRVRSAEERERSLEILAREAQRLSYLVENLLLFARPEEQRRRAAPERIDLGALAADVLEGFAPLAEARDATLRLQAPATATVHVDRDRMRQVLLNLLDNATKYGPDGQTVTVTVSPAADGRVALTVDDQGPGVPPAQRSLVWARFWRGPGVEATTGTGIGLSLVRELVESGGGDVEVDDAPGGGARFRILLPEAT